MIWGRPSDIICKKTPINLCWTICLLILALGNKNDTTIEQETFDWTFDIETVKSKNIWGQVISVVCLDFCTSKFLMHKLTYVFWHLTDTSVTTMATYVRTNWILTTLPEESDLTSLLAKWQCRKSVLKTGSDKKKIKIGSSACGQSLKASILPLKSLGSVRFLKRFFKTSLTLS